MVNFGYTDAAITVIWMFESTKGRFKDLKDYGHNDIIGLNIRFTKRLSSNASWVQIPGATASPDNLMKFVKLFLF